MIFQFNHMCSKLEMNGIDLYLPVLELGVLIWKLKQMKRSKENTICTLYNDGIENEIHIFYCYRVQYWMYSTECTVLNVQYWRYSTEGTVLKVLKVQYWRYSTEGTVLKVQYWMYWRYVLKASKLMCHLYDERKHYVVHNRVK